MESNLFGGCFPVHCAMLNSTLGLYSLYASTCMYACMRACTHSHQKYTQIFSNIPWEEQIAPSWELVPQREVSVFLTKNVGLLGTNQSWKRGCPGFRQGTATPMDIYNNGYAAPSPGRSRSRISPVAGVPLGQGCLDRCPLKLFPQHHKDYFLSLRMFPREIRGSLKDTTWLFTKYVTYRKIWKASE